VAFGLASLRDLPDIEKLKDEGLLQKAPGEDELNAMLGLVEEDTGRGNAATNEQSTYVGERCG
jgi:hypothetical protein